HLLVERDRPLEISDLQPDSTKSRRFRKSISLRPNATLCIGTHHLLCHCPLFSPLPSRIPHPASRLRLDTLSLISGPERLYRRKNEQRDENRLRCQRLHARIN